MTPTRAADTASDETRRVPTGTPDIGRDVRLFLVYRLLSTSYLFVPVFLLFFASRGLSVTEITLLNTVYCGTLLVFEVPTGVLADRWGRKRAMVLGSLMMAAGTLVDFVGHSFAVFAAGEGLLALGMTLSSGADSAYLFDLLRDAGREREYRRHEGTASAAKLVGSAVALAAGGWLAGSRPNGLAATYFVTAVVCVLAAAAAGLLRERPVRTTLGGGVAGQVAASARAVAGRPALLFAVLFSTVVFTLVRMALYLHQPYLTRAGYDVGSVGVVLAGLSLAAAWGAHRVDRLRRLVGERGLVVGVPAVLGVTYLVMGAWDAPWGVALLLVQSVLNGVYSPMSKELLNREILDSGQRATVLSVESMARRLAFGVFAPVCGAAMDRWGLGGGMYICAFLGVAGMAWFALALRRPSLAKAVIADERQAVPEIDSGRLAAEVQRP